MEIFRQKNTTRPLTEWSDTLPSQRGKLFAFPSCHTASVGVWGNAPQVKFRVGVRLPFSKGKEDWGAVRRRRGKAPTPSESPVF